MKRAVFLDRDGTINAMVYNPELGLVDSPQNPDEFNLLPEVGEAIRAINEAGFWLSAITFDAILFDLRLRMVQTVIDGTQFCPFLGKQLMHHLRDSIQDGWGEFPFGNPGLV